MTRGESFSTSPIVGASITSLAGEAIGRVVDVVVDASAGRLRFAVIELGGEDRLLVVPWEALTVRPAEREAVLGVNTETLKAAPGFDRDAWPRITDSRWDRETYAYYGIRPYWETSPQQEIPAYEPRPGHLGAMAVGVLLLVAIVGLGSLVYRQGWSTTSAQVHGVAAAVRETTDAVKDTSTDMAATAKVKAALALSKRVPASLVNVDTHDGVATLTGTVPSLDIKQVAGEIAADTSGVRDVRNLLNVEPGARTNRTQDRDRLTLRVGELERQTAIAEALQEQPELQGSRIIVRVDGDVVTLNGTVVSPVQVARAEEIARSFTGVREVRNNVR